MPADTNTAISAELIESKERWHRDQAALPLREKVRILLELQRQDLVFLRMRRPLLPWEEPWAIEP